VPFDAEVFGSRDRVHEGGERLSVRRVTLDEDAVAPLRLDGDGTPVHSGEWITRDDDVAPQQLQLPTREETLNRLGGRLRGRRTPNALGDTGHFLVRGRP